jgi:hypothetical protein
MAGLDGMVLLVLSLVVSFAAGRYFSRNWRRKRDERAAEERRRGESRQVRRARERRGP